MKKKSEKKVISNLNYLFKEAWCKEKNIYGYFVIYTILSALIPFLGIFTPKLLVNEYLGLKRTEVFMYILGGFLLLGALGYYITSYLKAAVEPKIMNIRVGLSAKLQEKCMNMDFKYTEDPDALNSLTNADRAVGSQNNGVGAIYTTIFSILGSMVAFGGYIAIVITLSPWVLLYLIANVLIVYCLTLKARKYEYGRKEERADIIRKRNYVYNTMSNFAYGKDIRIYKFKDWLLKNFRDFSIKSLNINSDIAKKNLNVSLIDVFLLLIREGVIYGYLIYRVIIVSDMAIDNFIMYFTTISAFAAWMQGIMNDIAFIKSQNMYVNDYRTFLDLGNTKEYVKYEEIPKIGPYEIEFRNVAFKYPNSDKYIYRNLSLKIKAGQRLAIVGINGAGKTTFVKLLCRLYEPTEGEILLNGINIKKFNKEEYFKLFSPVFQEIRMFAFSISENVALRNKEEINSKQVMECIERADVGDKVNSLEKGINTSLLKILDSEGIELSGGENQKLALARALYKNGGIVILDEPTAALDAVAEYKTYMRFNDFVGNKTAIYVSHRLASTRFCDVIAFFENGEVKEYGTHDELLEKNGRYREMFDIQARYYREDLVKEGA